MNWPGEQIVFTRILIGNSVFNGEVGTILKISEPDELRHAKIAITVNKANGRKKELLSIRRSIGKAICLITVYAVTA